MSVAAVTLAIGINGSIAALSAASIVAFVCAFSMGLGPVTWVVLSEVMPQEARTASGSVGLAVNWTTNFIMVRLDQPSVHELTSRERCSCHCKKLSAGAKLLERETSSLSLRALVYFRSSVFEQDTLC
jgi:hypothetical protein